MLLIALAFVTIQTPAEATALEGLGDVSGIVIAEPLQGLQSWVGQQLIKSGGREPSCRELKKLKDDLAKQVARENLEKQQGKR